MGLRFDSITSLSFQLILQRRLNVQPLGLHGLKSQSIYIYIYISQWTVATLKDPIQSSPTTSNYCYLHRMENYNHNNNQQWLEIRFEPQVRLFLTVTFPFRFVISPFFFFLFFFLSLLPFHLRSLHVHTRL